MALVMNGATRVVARRTTTPKALAAAGDGLSVWVGCYDQTLSRLDLEGATGEAIESLRRRSLIDRTQDGPAFTLQSVVLEYVTDRLLERGTDEIERGEFSLLQAQALDGGQRVRGALALEGAVLLRLRRVVGDHGRPRGVQG